MAGIQVQLPRCECKMQILWPAVIPEFGCGSQQRLWKLVQVYIQVCYGSRMAGICWLFKRPPVIMKGKDNTIGDLTAPGQYEHVKDFWRHYTRTSFVRIPHCNHWLIRETRIEWEKQKSQWSERQGLTAETGPTLSLILLDSTCAKLRFDDCFDIYDSNLEWSSFMGFHIQARDQDPKTLRYPSLYAKKGTIQKLPRLDIVGSRGQVELRFRGQTTIRTLEAYQLLATNRSSQSKSIWSVKKIQWVPLWLSLWPSIWFSAQMKTASYTRNIHEEASSSTNPTTARDFQFGSWCFGFTQMCCSKCGTGTARRVDSKKHRWQMSWLEARVWIHMPTRASQDAEWWKNESICPGLDMKSPVL
jgi:hypothetical protein